MARDFSRAFCIFAKRHSQVQSELILGLMGIATTHRTTAPVKKAPPLR
jgi:hypothetical protein